VLLCNVQASYGAVESPHLPDGEYNVIEGYKNLEIPCLKLWQTDILTWYKVENEEFTELYDSVSDVVLVEGYEVPRPNPMSHSLIILEVTDQYTGEYWCQLNRETPMVEVEVGTVHVNIQEAEVPNGIYRIEAGHPSYTLPCSMREKDDFLSWHRNYEGPTGLPDQVEYIYDTNLGVLVGDTFGVDASSPLDRHLVLFDMTEDMAGYYFCSIRYTDGEVIEVPDYYNLTGRAIVEVMEDASHLPNEDYVVEEGHTNLEIPCSKQYETDTLHWYKGDYWDSPHVYDSETGHVEAGYSVDGSQILSRNLVILEVTEQYTGLYTCLVTRDNTPLEHETGTANVSIGEEKNSGPHIQLSTILLSALLLICKLKQF